MNATLQRQAPYRQVIVICSDEHDPRHSGFGGSVCVRTPHLDRLADQSLQFTRCSTPSPICVPARASIATGRWVHRHRFWDNAIAYDGTLLSWHHRLRAAGASVEAIGKLHFRSAHDDTGFSAQHETMHLAEGVGQVWGSVRDPLPEHGGGAELFRRMGAGESDYNRFDQRVAEGARQWIADRTLQLAEAHAAGKDLAFFDTELTALGGGLLQGWVHVLLEPGEHPPLGETWTIYRLHPA